MEWIRSIGNISSESSSCWQDCPASKFDSVFPTLFLRRGPQMLDNFTAGLKIIFRTLLGQR